MKTKNLKNYLENLVEKYGKEYIESDPVKYPHLFYEAKDIEIAAIIASVFAYGNVKAIFSSLDGLFKLMGKSPYKFVANFNYKRGGKSLKTFIHRFNNGDDLITLFFVLNEIYSKWETLEDFFLEGYDLKDINVSVALIRFSKQMIEKGMRQPTYKKSYNFLFPSPENGSACKRLNMFLRWMVRESGGVDFGLWRKIPKSKLIFPLDTHTSRITSLLGLSQKEGASLKKALEVTENLKKLDENDPVKYDFSLSRLGILKLCTGKKAGSLCRGCLIYPVCKIGG